MKFSDIFKRSFLNGIDPTGLSMTAIVMVILVTGIIGIYIYAVYRFTTRRTFYSKSFNISLVALAMITAAIIITIQSSVVISLGMVGALSIVRFRTAVKEPMDLVFLFWSISVGIICGAGLYEVAVIVSVFVTVAILGLELMPAVREPLLLIIDAQDPDVEITVLRTVRKYVRHYQIRSHSLTDGGMNMIIEVRMKNRGGQLLRELKTVEGINAVSLLMHDGEAVY